MTNYVIKYMYYTDIRDMCIMEKKKDVSLMTVLNMANDFMDFEEWISCGDGFHIKIEIEEICL